MKIKSYALKTIREKAYNVDCKVVKGFQHCRDAVLYDKDGNRQSGYMVMDLRINCFVRGCYDEFYDFLWDLDDVIEFLKERYEALGLDW